MEPIFYYAMGATVNVTLAGNRYTGKIVSRLESHTGGISYAVYAKYKHATGAEWFMEREVSEALEVSNPIVSQEVLALT